MTRGRLSLGGLMVVVLLACVGLAALRGGDELWDSLITTLTFATLGLAVLGALFQSGARRAFCAGFAILGFGYLTLATGPWFEAAIGPRLFTTKLLETLYVIWSPEGSGSMVRLTNPAGGRPLRIQSTMSTIAAINPGQRLAATASSSRTVWPWAFGTDIPNPYSFQGIGHSIFALIAGMLGGLVARKFHNQPLRVAPQSAMAGEQPLP